MAAIRGCIFDLDGTLIDSRLDFEAIRGRLGFPSKTPILEFLETLSEPEQKRAREILHEVEIAAAHASVPISGAAEMLLALQKQGTRLSIFTRNSLASTLASLAKLPQELTFFPIVTREAGPPKPSEAGVLSILSQWNTSPQETVVIGDYLYDLQAARNAGVQGWLYWPTAELPSFASFADRILTDLREIPGLLARHEALHC